MNVAKYLRYTMKKWCLTVACNTVTWLHWRLEVSMYVWSSCFFSLTTQDPNPFFQCFVLCALSAANASTKVPNTIESLASTVTQQYLKTEPQLVTVIQNALYKCMNATAIAKLTTGLSTKIMPETGSFICDPNALLIKGCIAIEIFMVSCFN